MIYHYATEGTCSRMIEIETAADGTISDIRFMGGCHGNLQGIAALAAGHTPAELINRLKGIKCGNKSTSCPDQLARALEQIAAAVH